MACPDLPQPGVPLHDGERIAMLPKQYANVCTATLAPAINTSVN